MFEMLRSFTISTPMEMYYLLNAIETHSEYHTEYEWEVIHKLKDLSDELGVCVNGLPDLIVDEIEGGKVNITLKCTVYSVPTDKVLEYEVIFNNAMDEVMTYLIAKTNLEIPLRNMEEI